MGAVAVTLFAARESRDESTRHTIDWPGMVTISLGLSALVLAPAVWIAAQTKKIKVAPGTRHGTIQRLRGEGPPRKGGGRGDIRYRLEIAVPQDLSEDQLKAVDELAERLNGGDPRAELLRKARR